MFATIMSAKDVTSLPASSASDGGRPKTGPFTRGQCSTYTEKVPIRWCTRNTEGITVEGFISVTGILTAHVSMECKENGQQEATAEGSYEYLHHDICL